MKWEKIEYPWKGIKIPDSEIDSAERKFEICTLYTEVDSSTIRSVSRFLCFCIHSAIIFTSLSAPGWLLPNDDEMYLFSSKSMA